MATSAATLSSARVTPCRNVSSVTAASAKAVAFQPAVALKGSAFLAAAAFRKAAARSPAASVRAAASGRGAVVFAATTGVKKPVFPFSRIVGQEDMKLALLLNVVDPNIGGVLIMGDRGTAKSVTVRGLAELLPDMDVVPGDMFNSSPTDPKLMGPDCRDKFLAGETLPTGKARIPMVELPLGATEDRICGTIDIEKALSEGTKAYEPGLLAKANRGIMYVDEVNLLDDSLVDVVLDSAAGGWNTVEREGISIIHPAKFIMIGSGNPEEGELRPQLLDRFGTSVNVQTIYDAAMRIKMVQDRDSFESDPFGFMDEVKAAEEGIRDQILAAQDRLKTVHMPDDIKLKISEVCSMLDVDGLRGDIVCNRAAKALVAWEERDEVTPADVARVVTMVLNHRMRKDPMDPIDNGSKVASVFTRVFDPRRAAKEAEAAKKAEEAAAAAAKPAAKKAGAWGGLPGNR
mmetsp:Transcript_33223/g.105913  ORF Transcript_33223/g.105913 Transcript_33223/m.105913 type:complete len:460 (+) Transcript_33223:553-1932(+)